MKSLVLLVALSLMLVGAMVSVTLLDTAQAKKPNVVYCVEGTTQCAPTKSECENFYLAFGAKCVKTTTG